MSIPVNNEGTKAPAEAAVNTDELYNNAIKLLRSGRAQEGVGALQKASDSGSAKAKALLGLAYIDGKYGLEPDFDTGFKMVEEAAATEDMDALMVIGDLFCAGRKDKLHEDMGVGLDCIEHATQMKPFQKRLKNIPDEDKQTDLDKIFVNCLYIMGSGLLLGRYGIELNESLGVQYLKASADAGNVSAMCDLAQLYLAGLGEILPADKEKAEKLLRQAAQTGDAQGLNQYGVYFRLNKNMEEAKKWFQKSLKAGSPYGALNLLTMLDRDHEREELQECVDAIESQAEDMVNSTRSVLLSELYFCLDNYVETERVCLKAMKDEKLDPYCKCRLCDKLGGIYLMYYRQEKLALWNKNKKRYQEAKKRAIEYNTMAKSLGSEIAGKRLKKLGIKE